MPLSRRLTADDLARTDAEREALDRVRAMTGEADGPMERHGAGRGWLRGLWRAVPRDGIYPEVARIVGRALLERPATVPKIFIRGRGR